MCPSCHVKDASRRPRHRCRRVKVAATAPRTRLRPPQRRVVRETDARRDIPISRTGRASATSVASPRGITRVFFGWPNLGNRPIRGFLGLPGDNAAAEMQVVDVYRREGDKLVENWVLIGLLHWPKQQGWTSPHAIDPQSVIATPTGGALHYRRRAPCDIERADMHSLRYRCVTVQFDATRVRVSAAARREGSCRDLTRRARSFPCALLC
jgi:hypothetical protein